MTAHKYIKSRTLPTHEKQLSLDVVSDFEDNFVAKVVVDKLRMLKKKKSE